MARTYDYLFKLLLIGDKDVGKTSLMFRFMEDNDSSSFCALGVDFKVKTIELDGKKIKLQIWDTAGQECFSNITTVYYRRTLGIMLVYDITNEKSFENIEKRIQNIKEHAPSDVDWMIVGNNCDINDKRQVSKERGEKLAQSHSKRFIEVSAKSGINVKEAFYTLTRDIMTRLNQRMCTSEPQCTTASTEHRRETMDKDYDLFKLMMIGDCVGKSCLLLRYIKGSFKPDIDVTVVDMAIKMIELDSKKIQLQIWDTTGHESFRSVIIQCCRDAKGIMLVYDITDEQSFKNINNWIQTIQEHAPSDVDWIIVGNKCEMNDKRQVSKERGEKLAKSYSKKFMEVSAKSGINVEEAFYTLARDIMTRLRMNDPSSSSGPGKCSLL